MADAAARRCSRALPPPSADPHPLPAGVQEGAPAKPPRTPPAHLGNAYRNVFVETSVLEVVPTNAGIREEPAPDVRCDAGRGHSSVVLPRTGPARPAVNAMPDLSSPAHQPAVADASPRPTSGWWTRLRNPVVAGLVVGIVLGVLLSVAVAHLA